MIIDRTHRIWAAGTGAALILATGGYVAYSRSAPNGPHGGSRIGLLFGIVAASLMLFAGFLAVRRRLFYIPLGSRQFWLRGHIWLGLLSVPLGMFHAGFGWGGTVETALWALTALVVASGVYGLALQHVLPRQLTIQSPNETFVEQFAHRREILRVECDFLVSGCVGPLGLPAASLAKRFAEADALLHQTGSKEAQVEVAPAQPAERKPKREVQLPLTRAADYLREFRNWPADLGPLEKELGVRGRAQIEEMLARNGQQLSAIVQVGLNRGPLNKTDIWRSLPEFVAKIYGAKAVESADEKRSLAGAAASVAPAEKPLEIPREGTGEPVAPGESVPAKPLSKSEIIRQQQRAKNQKGSPEAPAGEPPAIAPVLQPASGTAVENGAAVDPATKPLSKAEMIRQQQLAKNKKASSVAPAGEAAASIPSVPDALAPTKGAAAVVAANQPLSKIEMIRQQQLTKNKKTSPATPASEAAGAETPAEAASGRMSEERYAVDPATKPLSKIEMIRQQQLAKNKKASPAAPAGEAAASAPPAETASGTTAEGGAAIVPANKPLSKIEMIRQQQLAKNKMASAVAPAGDAAASAPPAEAASGATAERGAAVDPATKPLSKIEMIRQQQLAKNQERSPVAPAGDAAASASPAEPAAGTMVEGVAADIPATRPLSKVEMIRQQQLAKNRKTPPESK